MPKIFILHGYLISIWSDEEGEPIHIHISKKRPTKNATKVWMLSNGNFELCHNKSRIPEHELRRIIASLTVNGDIVRASWISFHGYEKYYR